MNPDIAGNRNDARTACRAEYADDGPADAKFPAQRARRDSRQPEKPHSRFGFRMTVFREKRPDRKLNRLRGGDPRRFLYGVYDLADPFRGGGTGISRQGKRGCRKGRKTAMIFLQTCRKGLAGSESFLKTDASVSCGKPKNPDGDCFFRNIYYNAKLAIG